MKTDRNGCSTCPVGEERFEMFKSVLSKRVSVQYDFRHPVYGLFSTVAPSLFDARGRRDVWLSARQASAVAN